MTVQPIVYRGRRVAVATQTSYLLSTELEARPRDDPERLFVQFMCLHAADVLSQQRCMAGRLIVRRCLRQSPCITRQREA